MKRNQPEWPSEHAMMCSIVPYWEQQGAHVYQEVGHFGARCDLVAAWPDRLVIVEGKLHPIHRVIEQAAFYRLSAHQQYVAVPYTTPAFVAACNEAGVGCLIVTCDTPRLVFPAPLTIPDPLALARFHQALAAWDAHRAESLGQHLKDPIPTNRRNEDNDHE